jgi:isopentenyl phosphate kinase
MQGLTIIKFGGSSITKKSEGKFEINYSVLEQSAQELATALEKKEQKIILVCGVGPFGHTNVVKYNLNNGVTTKEQLEGKEITNKDCNFVGEEVAKALEKAGLNTKIIPAYLVCVQDNKKVVSYDSGLYVNALEQKLIPITTGIMVKDNTLNWSPMSGDTAIAQLCKQLKPIRVLIGTDVDGVFTEDPKINPKAKLIPEINKKNLEKIIIGVGESKSVDVTGGMRGKIEKLEQTLNGTPAQIFNLYKKKALERIVLGEEVPCTKIKL